VVSRENNQRASREHSNALVKPKILPPTNNSRPKTASPSKPNVRRCVDEIRSLIFVGDYLPGHALRQTELADRLGTSRIPVREALAVLESEGVVTYRPNIGHTVARLNRKQLAEIYEMRELLETYVLRTIDLASIDIESLVSLNDDIARASADGQTDECAKLNEAFHFKIFDASPLVLFRAEIARLWNMSGYYRALLIQEPTQRALVLEEHEAIIRAVTSRDIPQIIATTDVHRSWRGTSAPFFLHG